MFFLWVLWGGGGGFCNKNCLRQVFAVSQRRILNILQAVCTICVQYVGCTTNSLKVRIRRHLSDVNNTLAVNISAVLRHFQTEHAGDVGTFRFQGIERVYKPIRGGDHLKKRLSREAKWIFVLDTWEHNGMNIRQDIRYHY